MEPGMAVLNNVRHFIGDGKRQYPRFKISDIPLIRKVQSEDFKVKVVNILRGGALLRTGRRLNPGMSMKLHIKIAKDTIPFIGFVLRSDRSSSKWRFRYQAAVSFDRPLIVLCSYPETKSDPSETNKHPSITQPLPTLETAGTSTRRSVDEQTDIIDAFLAVEFSREKDPSWHERSRLNNW
ncbi:MAG: PilZ domain-containing protein [Acidobacteriota bacterium]